MYTSRTPAMLNNDAHFGHAFLVLPLSKFPILNCFKKLETDLIFNEICGTIWP